MSRIKIMLSALMLFCTTLMFGQQIQISGTITNSEDGLPVPGATIQAKGTSIGTITNFEGYYSLTVPEGTTQIVYSFIGMKTVEIPLDGRTSIDVILEPDLVGLEQVVVVGYGAQSKKLMTGSVVSVSSEDLENQPLPSIDQALQGKMAGVRVTQNSGTPGGGISVRIRGASSINADNQPLYVVDGVPINTGDYSQQSMGGQDLNATSSINPADIEDILVLKDAAYASIYGARAANGVVLITTKRGQQGKIKVNLNYSHSIQEIIKKRDLVNAEQYIELYNEAVFNSYGLEDYLGTWDDYNNVDTDWQDEVLRTGYIDEYQVSFSGGNDKVTYYLSGNHFNQDGIVIGSGYQRTSGRLNLDIKGSDRLKIGTSIQVSDELINRIYGDNNIYAPLANAFADEPIYPVYNEDGSYNTDMSYANPVAMGLEPKHNVTQFRLIGNTFAEFKIAESLLFKTSANYDVLNLREDSFLPTNIGIAQGSNGSGTVAHANVYRTGIENTLTYKSTFADIHNLTALAGFSYEKNYEMYTDVSAIQFPSNDFKWLDSAAEINDGGSSKNEYRLASYFGRLNYDFDKKYIAQVVVRADGSSRFGADNKYAYFPAASLAWRVTEEQFMQNIPILSDLKLRASLGTIGNQNIGNYRSLGLWFSGNNYQGLPGITPGQIPNKNLKWEKTTTVEGGVDFGLFEDRIYITTSYYVKKTSDLLLDRPLPGYSGFTTIMENIGKSENKGFELGINTVNVRTSSGFEWNTNFNISFNENKIVELYNGEPFDAGYANRFAEGQPFGIFYGYKFLEVDPETGYMVFDDINEDGAITADDRTYIGDPNPDFDGSITNTFSYKGFELSAFFQFVYGNDIYNAVRSYSEGFFWDNLDSRVLDRWQEPGDITDVPRAEMFNSDISRESSYKIEDGSFIRLKNISLSYNFPTELISKANLASLKIYVTGQNILTWTDYSGPDPEVNYEGTSNTVLGTDFYTYPVPKSWTIGVNVGF